MLTRELAETGHYPAIDVRSVSRVMANVVAAQRAHRNRARLRQLLSPTNKARILIQFRRLRAGPRPELDTAVRLHPQMLTLPQQDYVCPRNRRWRRAVQQSAVIGLRSIEECPHHDDLEFLFVLALEASPSANATRHWLTASTCSARWRRARRPSS